MTTTTKTKNAAVELGFDKDKGIATLTLKMSGDTNKINAEFSEGLAEATEWALARDGLKGIIIGTGHKNFCIGADIDVLYQQRDARAMYTRVLKLHEGFRRLETCGVPVVAALTGSAIGGGMELALSCHRRIAVNNDQLVFGQPGVQLGVIPGGGGTQRLPRMIGLQAAADIILQGRTLRASKAKQSGLVDELHDDADAVYAAAREWIANNPKSRQPWDVKGFKPPHPYPGTTEARDMAMVGCAMLYKKTAGAHPAAEYALCAMFEGAALNFDRALEVEARYFTYLATSDQAKDMIRTLWYHRKAAEKHQDLPGIDDGGIRKIGILGAGMMGAALAWVCSRAGYDVVVKDIKQEALERCSSHCDKLTRKLARHLDTAGKKELLDRIKPTLELSDLEGCDLIIEAVFENMALKHKVNRETEPLLADDAIWASNTSALPITELAIPSKAPERFIGMHFFSPVEQMQLIEIITAKKTDGRTLARALHFCKQIKKTPIVVNDGYAFYTTRLFASYLMEGVQLVAEGHDPALVEWAARAAGMVIGPLQVFDEVTLTLVRHAMDQGRKYVGDRAVDHDGIKLLGRMVDEFARSGRSAGKGFYDYDDKGKRVGIWPKLRELAVGKPDRSDIDELGQRLLLIQASEAVRALEDGVLQRRRDAEVGAVFGIGFAPNTGGPFSYLDRTGLLQAVTRLRAYADRYGKRYDPPQLLVQMAEKGECFFGEAWVSSSPLKINVIKGSQCSKR